MDVTRPATDEYVAIGAARQAAWVLAVIPRSSLKHTWRHFSFPTQSTNTAIIKSFEQVWR